MTQLHSYARIYEKGWRWLLFNQRISAFYNPCRITHFNIKTALQYGIDTKLPVQACSLSLETGTEVLCEKAQFYIQSQYCNSFFFFSPTLFYLLVLKEAVGFFLAIFPLNPAGIPSTLHYFSNCFISVTSIRTVRKSSISSLLSSLSLIGNFFFLIFSFFNW